MTDSLIFPWNEKIVETSWPFNRFGKSLDKLLKEKKFPLIKNGFANPTSCDGGIDIHRLYGIEPEEDIEDIDKGMYVVSVCYYRALELPSMIFENCGYYSSEDFEPSDVTWVGEYSITPKPYITTSSFIKALKSDQKGNEVVVIKDIISKEDNAIRLFRYGNEFFVITHSKVSAKVLNELYPNKCDKSTASKDEHFKMWCGEHTLEVIDTILDKAFPSLIK